MNRVGLVLSILIPAAIAGTLVVRTAASHADAGTGGSLGDWPAAGDSASGAPGTRVLIAQADPWAHSAPTPPSTPRPPRGHHRGVSVTFHDGKLELDGVEELVQDQLERVDSILDGIDDLPPEARSRIKARVRAVRSKIRAQLKQLKSIDVDQIGPAMERLGDEVEREMEGLDKELAQFGEQYGKSFEKFGKEFAKSFNIPSPPSVPTPAVPAIPAIPAIPAPPAPPAPPAAAIHTPSDNSDEADEDADDADHDHANTAVDSSVDSSAIANLKDVSLKPEQRAKLAQLRAEADAAVASAKRDLDEMSTQLQSSLGNPRTSESEIAIQIDKISAKEAEVRKARIFAWVRARNLLTADQRKQIEAAAKKGR